MTEYRNRPTLDKLEPYYSRHVSAMTTENLWEKSDIAAELAVRDMRIAELEGMLVPHPGETWDSDKPPIADRVFDLFAALSRLGTQDETESVRGTLRALLCNRDTLARRIAELEQQLTSTTLPPTLLEVIDEHE